MKRIPIAGVYTITNLVNGKIYVGKSVDVFDRLRHHLNSLKTQKHANEYLKRAFLQYGEENFVFELLEEWDKDLLFSMENYWVNLLNTTHKDYGYNLKGTSPTEKSIMSAETRLKISIANTGVSRISNRCNKIECLTTGRIFNTIVELSKFLGKSETTLHYHLHRNSDIGYRLVGQEEAPINYSMKVKVEHIPSGVVFDSIKEAADAFEMEYKTLYKRLKKNSSKNEFRYLNKENVAQTISPLKPVIHLESGTIYNSIMDVSRVFNLTYTFLIHNLNRNRDIGFMYVGNTEKLVPYKAYSKKLILKETGEEFFSVNQAAKFLGITRKKLELQLKTGNCKFELKQ